MKLLMALRKEDGFQEPSDVISFLSIEGVRRWMVFYFAFGTNEKTLFVQEAEWEDETPFFLIYEMSEDDDV